MTTLNNVVLFVVVLFVLSVGSVVPVSAHAEEGVQGRCDARLVNQRAIHDGGILWYLHTTWDVSTDDTITVFWAYSFNYWYTTEDGEQRTGSDDGNETRRIGSNDTERVRTRTPFIPSPGTAVSVDDVDVSVTDVSCTGR